ncbi:FkbM family methyltransferase [Winogradskyella wandonensis]|uniref:FkbM family methyltransferase n=1 Tax=Winogradskyella wandonensis TaxID=1442586 RepID=A0A4R1KUF5_9FLAO|nr:FkbM family methyltransferase [Winogradskyella wandonensis]TCK68836.1 FkbM family methyltransferase [Winogradskyella wandonensis]
MNRLLVKIYSLVPENLKKRIGQSQALKGLRKKLLYTPNGFKIAKVLVNHGYGKHHVNFNFVASIKIAVKAKELGIENTVLRNSFKLIDKFKPNRNDLVVFDVGSNFGYLAAVWSDSVGAKGKVLAFEPNRNLFQTIKKTIEANTKFSYNFEVYNLAIGSKKGRVNLNASAFSSNTEDMSAAIEAYDVDMVKLDDFVKYHDISQVDLLKIDVDGIELDILKGAERILKAHTAIVIVETNNDQRIIDHFRELDYLIYDMKLDLYQNSQTLPVNIFCVPKTLDKDVV